MGIKDLNRYLRENCNESIQMINIADLSGKRIAIDISIYLYKYDSEDLLMENMYLMLSILRYYNIIPIFIFDGKPPPEKNALLTKRRQDKIDAQLEYDKLKLQLDENMKYNEKKELVLSMKQLKQQMVQINKEKVDKVKTLIRAYGATYYDAPSEADELCALLVLKKKAWACLSEDTDLFVYGCSRVLRYFSLINHTVVLYHMKGILKELDMTQDEFKDVCILSGTDYSYSANSNANNNNEKMTLDLAFKQFRIFKELKTENEFYGWLLDNTKYINDIELLNNIKHMFELDVKHHNLEMYNQIKIFNAKIRLDEVENIMRDDDFIFM